MAEVEIASEVEEPEVTGLSPKTRVMLAVGALTTLVVMVSVMVRWQKQAELPTPEEQLDIALKLLTYENEPDAWNKAGRIARYLHESKYLPPDSAGMIDFVRGIATFRRAERADVLQAAEIYKEARDHLVKAELNAIHHDARPEWAYALGVSLYQLHELRARKLLEEALKSFPRERTRIVKLLCNLALETKREEDLSHLLTLNREVIDDPKTSPEQKSTFWQLRSELLLRMNRVDEAEAARKEIDTESLNEEGEIVFRARIHLAREEYLLADELLQPLSRKPGLEQKFPRQASFLLGEADLMQNLYEPALEHYDETLKRFPETPEALAATLRAAQLLQNFKRDEESLQLYEAAMREIQDPPNFRNPWVSLEEVRTLVSDAWNRWIEREVWKQAVELARHLVPLYPKRDALNLEAQANQRWAEWLEQQYESIPEEKRPDWRKQTYDQWNNSGKSWKALTGALNPSSEFRESLWNSAVHFHRAHRYQEAEEQLKEFLDYDDSERKATALVRLGEVLLALNRIDEAGTSFQRVISDYSTSPVVFEAQLWRGKAYMEQDQPDRAVEVWLELIQSELLSPEAREWQLGIFELGRLHFYLAEKHLLEAEVPEEGTTEEQLTQIREQSFDELEQAQKFLTEFLRRYPNAPNSPETRYLLARTLQLSTIEPRMQEEEAETENARRELKRQTDQLYKLALTEFEVLEQSLTQKSEHTALSPLEKQLLRKATFELGHTQYALRNYSEALSAYQRALNRYPVDEQIYLIYLQMADVYDQLNQPAEAQNMLEQARIILRQSEEQIAPETPDRLNQAEWQEWLSRMRQFYGNRDL